jgi:TIR domain
MPGKLFVNYRRDDTRHMAARIRDRLAATFGDANVFMDVDDLLAGQRFDKELEKALNETDVFLAVIGPNWLELLAARHARGERDYVREEIAGALQRGIVIIPVLIERTPLPRIDALAEDIRDLVLHQTHEVSHARFGRDVAELVEAIRRGRKAARAAVVARRAGWAAEGRTGKIVMLLASLLVLVTGPAFLAILAPAPIYKAISLLPPPLAGPVRETWDYFVLNTAARRDGFRWIDVGDPQLRKVDKLPRRNPPARTVAQ